MWFFSLELVKNFSLVRGLVIDNTCCCVKDCYFHHRLENVPLIFQPFISCFFKLSLTITANISSANSLVDFSLGLFVRNILILMSSFVYFYTLSTFVADFEK